MGSVGSRNKAKGYRFEREFVDNLLVEFAEYPEVAAHIERHGAVYGVNDRGDIRMGPIAWVWELKNVQRFDLAGFMKELEREIQNHPNAENGAVIIKARMKQAKYAYSVLPAWRLVKLLKENYDLKRQLQVERDIRKNSQ
ncbi:hypothetical protein IPZ58_05070 [Streptomyces roseoverticillatus]|uniref:hypothetical protein n=1 Tax=Streptomyces roseoverticillatus TaxID=66429 RepID=UPI001F32756B|nr:hypothetical protein [Streptomyces roseoverticillatus]MCF3100946.1 hypothetical protein [Streptomyces roseoverticillatus]